MKESRCEPASDTRPHHFARKDRIALRHGRVHESNRDATEQNCEVFRQCHRRQYSRDLETRSGTVEVDIQRVCELSHHETRSHLLRSLSPVAPSRRPDFASRFISRNCLIHWKTVHQIEFSIHTFNHFIKRKFSQRVLLKMEAVSYDSFELYQAVVVQ